MGHLWIDVGHLWIWCGSFKRTMWVISEFAMRVGGMLI